MNRVLISSAAVLAASACVLVGPEAVDYANFSQAAPLERESRLVANLDLGVGELRIEPGEPSQMYDVDVRYNQAAFEPRLDYSSDGEEGRLRFSLESERSVRNAGKNEVTVSLNPDVVLELDGDLGVGRSQLDLGRLRIERLQLRTGVGETDISILTPNAVACRRAEIRSGVGSIQIVGLGNLNFETLEFDGGVGGAELDFTGEWETEGRVDIKVGVGGVEIALPREIGAEIRSTKSFLSGLDLKGFRKSGDVYRSDNIDEAKKVIRFTIASGIGGVKIRWI